MYILFNVTYYLFYFLCVSGTADGKFTSAENSETFYVQKHLIT